VLAISRDARDGTRARIPLGERRQDEGQQRKLATMFVDILA